MPLLISSHSSPFNTLLLKLSTLAAILQPIKSPLSVHTHKERGGFYVVVLQVLNASSPEKHLKS